MNNCRKYSSLLPAEVQACRARSGLTQAQAADAVRVDIRTWQLWEAGERAMPLGLFELFKIKCLLRE
jgi:DNA-binding XRE family transcriptional regulator